jgi:hypothetical protein
MSYDFFLSHFRHRPTSLKLTGPETVTRSSCAIARFVCVIPSSVTDAAVSRRMMNVTTGLGLHQESRKRLACSVTVSG